MRPHFERLEDRLLLSAAVMADAGPDQTVDEGDLVQFAGSFTDPGGGGGGAFTVLQLTTNGEDEKQIDAENNRAVWIGNVGPLSAGDVYYFDGASTLQLTNDSDGESLPRLEGDYVAWVDDGAIMLYDTTTNDPNTAVAISTSVGPISRTDLEMDGDYVVWTEQPPAQSAQVWAHHIPTSTTFAVDFNPIAGSQVDPKISGNYIVWRAPGTGGFFDIYIHDLTTSTTVNLSDSVGHDEFPQIDGDLVLWMRDDAGPPDNEIYLVDLSTVDLNNLQPGDVVQLTSDNLEHGGLVVADGRAAWVARPAVISPDPDQEAYVYDHASGIITQLTNNTVDEFTPDIEGGNVVWTSSADGDFDIYLYDGVTTTQVNQDNTYRDDNPILAGSSIFWLGEPDGAFQDEEVFVAQSYTFDWDFDDGDTTDGTLTPAHVFEDNGVYNVTLTVTDSVGNFNTDTVVITVDNVAPTAQITVAPAAGDEGTQIDLSGVGDDVSPVDVLTLTWEVFKDGGLTPVATGSGDDFSFTPDDDGSYEAVLTVTDDDGDSGSDSAVITVNNVAPTLGPLVLDETSIDEGGAVELSGSFTDPGAGDAHDVTVTWGDGDVEVVNLAAGVLNFNISHTYDDDDPTGTPFDDVNISVTVADEADDDTGGALVTVNNVAPTIGSVSVSASGGGDPEAGDTVDLTALFNDVGVNDTHTALIAWGDNTDSAGTVDQFAGSVSASHVYTDGGSYTVTVTVTDDDTGETSAMQTTLVIGTGIQDGVLNIIGSSGSDVALITPGGGGTVNVITGLPGSSSFNLADFDSILILGGDGADILRISNSVNVDAIIDGGDGTNLLRGGGGNDVIIGGSGVDLINGGQGRDILIGGDGSDIVLGQQEQDIMIAGYTAFDGDYAALAAIRDEWVRTDLSYQQRIDSITSGVGPGSMYALNASTVFDDNNLDILIGGSALDWFFYEDDGFGDITDQRANEVGEDIDVQLIEEI